LLAGARGFYLSLLERVFHVKILCLRAVISFSFFVIAYRFYNILPAKIPMTLEKMRRKPVRSRCFRREHLEQGGLNLLLFKRCNVLGIHIHCY
jgi:uncharacterized membrane protein